MSTMNECIDLALCLTGRGGGGIKPPWPCKIEEVVGKYGGFHARYRPTYIYPAPGKRSKETLADKAVCF